MVRVGFAHYYDAPRFTTELWQQPENTLVVPLGLPATSVAWLPRGGAGVVGGPEAEAVEGRTRDDNHVGGNGNGYGTVPLRAQTTNGLGSVSAAAEVEVEAEVEVQAEVPSRRGSARDLVWAYAGRAQNMNRQEMLRNLDRLNVHGPAFVHVTSQADDSSWAGGLARSIDPHRYGDVLSRAVLAPSPVGNSHPECYRTYEALAFGALPVVDTDYYEIVFGAPFYNVRTVGREGVAAGCTPPTSHHDVPVWIFYIPHCSAPSEPVAPCVS